MNFQEMDALGGLIEGNKARMSEDTTRINQENVLAQIAKMAQEQQQSAQMHPLKMQEMQSQNEERASLGRMRDQQMQESQSRTTRENAAAYVKAVIQQGHLLTGPIDALAEQFKIPATHPVRAAVKSAQQASQGWTPKKEGDLSPIAQLQQALAMGDDASRQSTATAEAQHARTVTQENARDVRNQRDNERARYVAEVAANAKQAAARLSQQAAATKNFSLQQYAARLIAEADAASAAGDQAKATKIRQDAEAAMQQAIRYEAAKGTAKEEAEAARLSAITGGQIDVTGSGRAGAAAAAAGPTVGGGTAAPAGRDPVKEIPGYDPAKFEYRWNAQTNKWQSKPKAATAAPAAKSDSNDYTQDKNWFKNG